MIKGEKKTKRRKEMSNKLEIWGLKINECEKGIDIFYNLDFEDVSISHKHKHIQLIRRKQRRGK